MKRVETVHHYPCDADLLWEVVTEYTALNKVMVGLARFDGLPSGHMRQGQNFEIGLSLFGWFPPKPYHIEIVRCDHGSRTVETREHGLGLRCWRHTIRVMPTSKGSRLTEEIEIDGGCLTWLYALWAHLVYRARHAPRLRVLTEMSPQQTMTNKMS